MDIQLAGGIWLGLALRVLFGWLIAMLRAKSFLPFELEHLPSMGTVAAIGGAGGFVSVYLTDAAAWPDGRRFAFGLVVGFIAQVLFRDALKGVGQPLAPPSQPPFHDGGAL